MPKVSVLIPTYNPNAAYLREALQRLQKQTETDWNAFIHDDNSKIDVRGLVEPFLSDTRIRFEHSPLNLRIGGNWNACWKGINAPIVAYLFQDDIWEPTYLEVALKVLNENPDVGFVSIDHRYQSDNDADISDFEKIHEERRAITPGIHRGEEFLHQWIEHELHPNLIGEPSFVVIRKDILDRVGPFDVTMPQCLDLEYWLRCLQVTDWAYVHEMHGAFRIHPDAATAQNEREGRGIYDRFICFQRLIASLPNGDLRRLAIMKRNHAFETMVAKFFARKKGGGDMKAATGSSVVKKFALMHPWIVIRGILRSRM